MYFVLVCIGLLSLAALFYTFILFGEINWVDKHFLECICGLSIYILVLLVLIFATPITDVYTYEEIIVKDYDASTIVYAVSGDSGGIVINDIDINNIEIHETDDGSAKIEYAKKIVFEDTFAEMEYDGSVKINSLYLPRGTI